MIDFQKMVTIVILLLLFLPLVQRDFLWRNRDDCDLSDDEPIMPRNRKFVVVAACVVVVVSKNKSDHGRRLVFKSRYFVTRSTASVLPRVEFSTIWYEATHTSTTKVGEVPKMQPSRHLQLGQTD